MPHFIRYGVAPQRAEASAKKTNRGSRCRLQAVCAGRKMDLRARIISVLVPPCVPIGVCGCHWYENGTILPKQPNRSLPPDDFGHAKQL
jgi:hypothetical protein